MRTLMFLWILLAGLPSVARAQVSGVVNQRVVALLGPEGAEHAIGVGMRARLGDPEELLFSGAHAEAGIINYTSPIYSMTGGYLQVSPLAFLVLRGEFTRADHWPIGLTGAGYYPVEGYGASLSGESLSPDQGQSASGWNVSLSTILQGAIPLGSMRLILWNQLSFDHISLGSAPFHYYPRYDTVLARQEWTVGNWGMLMLDIPIMGGVRARVGIYDDARIVPRSGFVSNQAGLIAMLPLEEVDPLVPEVTPFLRAGVVTNGRRAVSPTLLLGVMVRYDLGTIRD